MKGACEENFVKKTLSYTLECFYSFFICFVYLFLILRSGGRCASYTPGSTGSGVR